jgi:hypothetical protein
MVNTAILRPMQDLQACAVGAPKMLMRAGIKNVKLRSCYCCSEYGFVAFVVEAASRDGVLEAFNRINVPVASILEVEEVPLTLAPSVTT